MATFGDVRSAIHNGEPLPLFLPPGSGDYIAAHVARCLREGAPLPGGWAAVHEAREVVATHVETNDQPLLADEEGLRNTPHDRLRGRFDVLPDVYGVRPSGLSAARLRVWMVAPVVRTLCRAFEGSVPRMGDLRAVIDLREQAALGLCDWRDADSEAFRLTLGKGLTSTAGRLAYAIHYNNGHATLDTAARAHVEANLFDPARHDSVGALWLDDELRAQRQTIFASQMAWGWGECLDRLRSLTREDFARMIRGHS